MMSARESRDIHTSVLEALMRTEAEGAEDTAGKAAGTQESETLSVYSSEPTNGVHNETP
jgi:hypothetical protein